MKNDRVKNGKCWLDINGNKMAIQAPQIYVDDGVYYMFGVNSEKSYKGTGCHHYGVRCYRSTDFYNWENLGNIIEPSLTDYDSVLYPGNPLVRPHIVYCKKTGKFVAWLHSDTGAAQFYTVLTADKFTGPYTVVKEYYRPLDMNCGDFDIAVDERTGEGYFFFVRMISSVIAAHLSDDFLDVVGPYTVNFEGRKIPYAREGIAHFERNGKHYLMTSGQTYFYPNKSEVAISDSPIGPYRVLDDPYPDDKSNTSFCSQPADVVKLVGKQSYVIVADRWVPGFPKSRWFNKMFIKAYEKGARNITDDYFQKADCSVRYPNEPHKGKCPLDMRKSMFTVLPIRFEGAQPIIDWQSEWKTEDLK